MSLSKTPTDSCTGGSSFTYFHVTVPELACKVGEGVHNLEYLPRNRYCGSGTGRVISQLVKPLVSSMHDQVGHAMYGQEVGSVTC